MRSEAEMLLTSHLRSLGQAEMYLALSTLFRPDGPKLELFETDESDVTRAHDFIISLPKIESKGIRVMVR